MKNKIIIISSFGLILLILIIGFMCLIKIEVKAPFYLNQDDDKTLISVDKNFSKKIKSGVIYDIEYGDSK